MSIWYNRHARIASFFFPRGSDYDRRYDNSHHDSAARLLKGIGYEEFGGAFQLHDTAIVGRDNLVYQCASVDVGHTQAHHNNEDRPVHICRYPHLIGTAGTSTLPRRSILKKNSSKNKNDNSNHYDNNGNNGNKDKSSTAAVDDPVWDNGFHGVIESLAFSSEEKFKVTCREKIDRAVVLMDIDIDNPYHVVFLEVFWLHAYYVSRGRSRDFAIITSASPSTQNANSDEKGKAPISSHPLSPLLQVYSNRSFITLDSTTSLLVRDVTVRRFRHWFLDLKPLPNTADLSPFYPLLTDCVHTILAHFSLSRLGATYPFSPKLKCVFEERAKSNTRRLLNAAAVREEFLRSTVT